MKINKESSAHPNREELEKLSDLLKKYLEDQCSETEKEAIAQWYESLSGEREMKISDELAAKSKIWNNIEAVTSRDLQEKRINISAPLRVWLRWAASITIFCLTSLFIYLHFSQQKNASPFVALTTQKDWIVKTNSTGSLETILLPDSSTVVLQPDAVIGYPQAFSQKERLIHFKGEAFFSIQSDATKPFKVLTGNITTKVLGTSFDVKANDASSVVEVNVRTGRVSVYEDSKADANKSDGVILTPNQKVIYYKKEKKWVTELVHDPHPVVDIREKSSALVFKDNLMRDVLGDIARVYCIDLMVENEKIYTCTFTGDVSQMELYDMLKVICRSIRATYEVRGTRILINGEGCTDEL